MLSRLHRRAEALDEACLRAWGYPHDHAIQQELLTALEWDTSLHPEHARPLIRDVFRQVIVCSNDLSNCIRAGADASNSAVQSLSHSIQGLRQSLTTLIRVLEKRQVRPPNIFK
jgi:hypothetical protein